ncbi:MAG: 2-oxoacid:acceptor oxidoreductase subunit alpha, partial [Candidatus Omnitrophica bacterium]|nr:2-oxoacid:acceptor oxidoreductase subunit alpha [Candidatus Omnitrophota bacterium]
LQLAKGALTIPIVYGEILQKVAAETGADYSKIAIVRNAIAVAASMALLKLDLKYLFQTLEEMFTGRKAQAVPLNIAAAKHAFAAVPPEVIERFPYHLQPTPNTPKRLLVTGTTATALGKLKAGCRFQTYYPITPASDESVYLEGRPEYGALVVQAEDEIAALLMAISAGITGVRAATSTSGPGMCLMTEGLGWAGMNEVPVVIVNYQRGGPATGLPTRTEQGDLKFVLSAAHGEFPRIVLAPGDPAEYFEDAFEAFNDAERYQTPVILLGDKTVANNTETILPFKEDHLRIQRGELASEAALAATASNGGQFPRFAVTESGVSPRAIPGQPGGLFWMSGDEHDALGHISEDPENRIAMHDKRMRKLRLAAREIPLARKLHVYGDDPSDVTLVSWGSPKGAILDALPILRGQGIRCRFIQVHLMWPFPGKELASLLKGAPRVIDIEMNYTGQLATLIRQETGLAIPHAILKWTGRPISESELVAAVTEVVKTNAPRVVLRHGR